MRVYENLTDFTAPDCMASARRLPHQYPENTWLFITWHLHGSLPQNRYPPVRHPGAGEAFVWMDRFLDTTASGPKYLNQPPIAQIVLDALRRGIDLGHYKLRAFVIMPNHVHVLLLPRVPPAQLLRGVKGCTAREANKVLGLTGERFWQQESYDHWIRDEKEFEKIVRYIESNPVKAGLAGRPEEFRWSSASAGSVGE
jgi:REP element-mobilizing transposase RayT